MVLGSEGYKFQWIKRIEARTDIHLRVLQVFQKIRNDDLDYPLPTNAKISLRHREVSYQLRSSDLPSTGSDKRKNRGGVSAVIKNLTLSKMVTRVPHPSTLREESELPSEVFTTSDLLRVFSTPRPLRFKGFSFELEAPITDPSLISTDNYATPVFPTFITCNALISVGSYKQ